MGQAKALNVIEAERVRAILAKDAYISYRVRWVEIDEVATINVVQNRFKVCVDERAIAERFAASPQLVSRGQNPRSLSGKRNIKHSSTICAVQSVKAISVQENESGGRFGRADPFDPH